MIIREIKDINEANKCDELLTLLIKDEGNYDDSIKNDFIVKEYFKNMILNKDNILIGAFDNDLIGYIFIKIIIDPSIDKKEALIDGLYVLDSFRNKGVASLLYEKAKEICKENNVDSFKLNVMKENINAINLYKKLGFDIVSYQMKTKI